MEFNSVFGQITNTLYEMQKEHDRLAVIYTSGIISSGDIEVTVPEDKLIEINNRLSDIDDTLNEVATVLGFGTIDVKVIDVTPTWKVDAITSGKLSGIINVENIKGEIA